MLRFVALKKQKRRRLMARRRAAPGAPPGTLTVDPSAPPPLLRVMSYGPGELMERTLADPSELPALLGKQPVLWLNVDGLGNADVLARIGQVFELHPLLLEDVINVHQRPKAEEFGKNQFVVLHQVMPSERGVATEQVSLVLGPGYLLTFQVTVGDCLDPVRERVRRSRGHLRQSGPDYLAYAVIDGIVDHYFPLLDRLTEQLLGLEEQIVTRPDPEGLRQVYALKHELLTLRRTISPMRETVGQLQRGDVTQVTPETRLYLRDTHDHCFQLMEVIDTSREIAAGLMDLYLSSVSQRLNEIMKVLTIISTIFIPLSFIASVYGMNFHGEASPWNMPELRWRYGYPLVLLFMGSAGGAMLFWFWRQGWIGWGSAPLPEPEQPQPAPAPASLYTTPPPRPAATALPTFASAAAVRAVAPAAAGPSHAAPAAAGPARAATPSPAPAHPTATPTFGEPGATESSDERPIVPYARKLPTAFDG